MEPILPKKQAAGVFTLATTVIAVLALQGYVASESAVFFVICGAYFLFPPGGDSGSVQSKRAEAPKVEKAKSG